MTQDIKTIITKAAHGLGFKMSPLQERIATTEARVPAATLPGETKAQILDRAARMTAQADRCIAHGNLMGGIMCAIEAAKLLHAATNKKQGT